MKFLFALLATLSLSVSTQAQSAGHDHHLALFLGATAHHSKTHSTMGIDYEYLLTPMWGIGAVAETVKSDPDMTVLAALLFIHPIDHLKFFIGAGNETVSSHSTSLTRIGAAYDFHIGEYSISPTVANDHLDGGNSAVVYGISFGIGF
jgi:hypothetical protein